MKNTYNSMLKQKVSLRVVAHTFNPNTREKETSLVYTGSSGLTRTT